MPERSAWREDSIGAVWSEWDSPEHLRRSRGGDMKTSAPPIDPPDRSLGEENPTEPVELPPLRFSNTGNHEF